MIQIIKEHADQLQDICQKSLVQRLELFGSATTKEYVPGKSDLDFIVTFKPEVRRRRLGQYLNLKESLEGLFKSNVDLISDIPIKNPYFQKSVNETRLCIYDGKKTIYNYKLIKPIIMKHDVRKYLWDIQQCINRLNDKTYGKTREDYMHDLDLQDIVVLNYITIGEAIKGLARIDEQTTSQITNYKDYISFRNVLVHQYRGIDHDIVWSKIEDELYTQKCEIDALLNNK